MTYKETEILISKYLNGETTVEEEKRLALEVMRDDAPEEWRMIGAMLGELTTDEALFDHIMAQRSAQKPKRPIYIIRWAVAASILVLIGFGFLFTYFNNGEDEQSLMAHVETINTELPAKATESPTKAPQNLTVVAQAESSPKAPVARKRQVAKQEPKTIEMPKAETISNDTVRPDIPEETEKIPSTLIITHEPQVVQASDDSQDPALVNQFIGTLAKSLRADSMRFEKPTPDDKNGLSALYIFEDDKEKDIFGRLIQVACWYDNTQPGFRLNISNRQLYFELVDNHNNIQYLWIAERSRGNILLHCARATVGMPILSQGYMDFKKKYSDIYIL